MNEGEGDLVMLFVGGMDVVKDVVMFVVMLLLVFIVTLGRLWDVM